MKTVALESVIRLAARYGQSRLGQAADAELKALLAELAKVKEEKAKEKAET